MHPLVFTESDVADIERRIGYSFWDKRLLERCFIHSTYGEEHRVEDNEKLEFLGDSVLSLVVSEKLYYEETTEGGMTEHRKKMVALQPLLIAVQRLGVDKYLIHGGGGANVGQKNISSLFETLAGGIYLDGGLENAKRFVLKGLDGIEDDSQTDYKGMLQEYTQSVRRGELPRYVTVFKEGKDNAPVYTVKVEFGGQHATGQATKKKEAERLAAKALLAKLKV